VFVEGLAAGWQDWSWNSAVNPFQSEPVRSGRRSLAWYPFGGGAGLKLHSDQPVDPARYPFLEFWAQARAPATGSYSVMLFGRDETPLGRSIPLAAVGGDPVADHWTQYRLALADFGIAGAPISSFAIVETSGWGSPGVYFDDIVFTSGLSAAPPPAPLPETANDWVVYGDVLGFGWRNYSWGGEAQFDYTADRAEGSRAIRFAPSEGYGSLSLYRDPPVDTSPFSALQFSARASSGSVAYGVVFYDENDTPLTLLPLANYGGDPESTAFRTFTIPLTDLGVANRRIRRITFTSLSDTPQPPVLFDNIRLMAAPLPAVPS
jgi:hypothetical protein